MRVRLYLEPGIVALYALAAPPSNTERALRERGLRPIPSSRKRRRSSLISTLQVVGRVGRSANEYYLDCYGPLNGFCVKAQAPSA